MYSVASTVLLKNKGNKHYWSQVTNTLAYCSAEVNKIVHVRLGTYMQCVVSIALLKNIGNKHYWSQVTNALAYCSAEVNKIAPLVLLQLLNEFSFTFASLVGDKLTAAPRQSLK